MASLAAKQTMPILATGASAKPEKPKLMQQQQQGFTLIEIMVVVVIIGVFMAATVPAMIPDSRAKLLKHESRKLHAVIKMAREDAMLDGEEFALGVWQTGYAFYTPDDSETGWKPVEGTKPFIPHTLPQDMLMHVAVDDTGIVLEEEIPEQPQIYLFSTGEFTPFSYTITMDEHKSKTYAFDPLGRLIKEADG